MYTGLLHLHSSLPYLFLLAIVFLVLKSIVGYGAKKNFEKIDNTLALVTMILAHIQLLVGIIMLSVSGFFSAGMKEIMQNPELRLKAIEHPMTMVIAIILITIGRKKVKSRESAQGKQKAVMVFYGLGLVLVLSRIPWSTWM